MNPLLPFAVIGVLSLFSIQRNLADDEQSLGGLLYSDQNLSLNRNQSCASCHGLAPASDRISGLPLPAPGFVDPANVRSNAPVSNGSVSGKAGSLNAPSAGYAAFSPEFHWDAEEETYVGGQFWNGRASDLQGQAALPFLNPSEMALPSPWAVVTRIKENATYRQLFEKVYGIHLDDIPGFEQAPATNLPPAGVLAVYDSATQAISEFERGQAFNKFNSKFDYWVSGMIQLSPEELRGFNLFTNKAGCSACHPSTPTTDARGNWTPPLFTDFTYDNIGLPKNVMIPGNPAPDLGLGGRPEIASGQNGGEQLGKQKVMSLRNIAITPPYGHNGVFETLEQVVHFYNTRDVLARVGSNTDEGFGVTGWPEPEVPVNVNDEELGDLRLTVEEEADLVAFLKTLTDNYPDLGTDPTVPPGTPSPYPQIQPPTIPTHLGATTTGILLSGRLGKFYRLDSTDSLGAVNPWQTFTTTRLLTNGTSVVDFGSPPSAIRFYRATQIP